MKTLPSIWWKDEPGASSQWKVKSGLGANRCASAQPSVYSVDCVAITDEGRYINRSASCICDASEAEVPRRGRGGAARGAGGLPSAGGASCGASQRERLAMLREAVASPVQSAALRMWNWGPPPPGMRARGPHRRRPRRRCNGCVGRRRGSPRAKPRGTCHRNLPICTSPTGSSSPLGRLLRNRLPGNGRDPRAGSRPGPERPRTAATSGPSCPTIAAMAVPAHPSCSSTTPRSGTGASAEVSLPDTHGRFLQCDAYQSYKRAEPTSTRDEGPWQAWSIAGTHVRPPLFRPSARERKGSPIAEEMLRQNRVASIRSRDEPWRVATPLGRTPICRPDASHLPPRSIAALKPWLETQLAAHPRRNPSWPRKSATNPSRTGPGPKPVPLNNGTPLSLDTKAGRKTRIRPIA